MHPTFAELEESTPKGGIGREKMKIENSENCANSDDLWRIHFLRHERRGDEGWIDGLISFRIIFVRWTHTKTSRLDKQR